MGLLREYLRKELDTLLRNDIRFMDGLSTLAHQVKRTFFLWTGIQVPPEEFLKVINANL